jgi:7-alpha-hydroxysteroid dehydrogenase
MTDYSLEGKIAIVTGGTQGIGGGITRRLAEAGAAVAIVARTKDDVERVAAEVEAGGGRALPVVADVTDYDRLPDIVDATVAAFGGIDILVNNAGGEVSPMFLDTRVKDFEDVFRFNVIAPFELSRLAVPHMLERPGASIVNISSITAGRSIRGQMAHHTGKTAEVQLTLSMAAELGPKIRVNAVLPGAVLTERLEWYFREKGDFTDKIIAGTRLKRMATPDDVGYAVQFLASPAASYITGVLFEMDGGAVDEGTPMFADL